MSDHLDKVRQVVEQDGKTCLSQQWQGWHTHYRFRCAGGHEWERTASNVVHYGNTFCPDCRKTERLTQVREAAQSQGGDCLETVYLGNVPHRFVCAQGHVWSALTGRILNGSWCRRCRAAEQGEQLKLKDGLARLQGIAQAHGGRCLADHYEGGSHRYAFQCARGHQWAAAGAEILRGRWCSRCANIEKRTSYLSKDGLARLHEAAQARGGVCLSDNYTGAIGMYRFRCREGHEWDTTGNRILRGAWCYTCGHVGRRLGIDRMRDLAEARGGRCLSDTYQNSQTKLQWQCHRGHTWWAIPAGVVKCHWCAECAFMDRIRSPTSKAWAKYRKAGHIDSE